MSRLHKKIFNKIYSSKTKKRIADFYIWGKGKKYIFVDCIADQLELILFLN